MIDLLDDPKVILGHDFDPYSCAVLGISIGSPASSLEGWEIHESTEYGWCHLQGGIAFRVRNEFVYQIKLPVSFFERLGIPNDDALIKILGSYDDTRHVIYRDKLMERGYLWKRGILAWWSILPVIKFSNLVIFDPRHGVAQDSKNVKFRLDNGEERHREAAATFHIPSKERRENLVAGNLVKLMFRITIDDAEFVERMWVQVTEARPSGYVGMLDNDPYCTSEILSGLRVEFQSKHVIQIWEPTK